MIADGIINAAALGTTVASGVEQVIGSVGGGSACYVSAREIDTEFRVKVDDLEGTGECSEDMYVLLELYSAGTKLCDTAYTARCRSSCTETGRVRWQQWVKFPIRYCDLPLDALLCLTVWSSRSSEPVGGTCTYLCSTRGQFKRGLRRLLLHKGVHADGTEPSTTLGKIKDKTFVVSTEKRIVQFNLNQLSRVDWLDRVTFKEINDVKRRLRAGTPGDAFLLVDFPIFSMPVFHVSLSSPIPANYHPVPNGGLVTVRDPGIELCDNPCEQKAVQIMKSQHLAVDPDLKPNAAQHSKIQAILRYSPLRAPTSEDGDLLWRFRYFLSKNKLGFTKFMRCVDWTDPREENMAKQLIAGWGGLKLEDCLELLSVPFRGIAHVRDHAVSRLDEETVDTLLSVILQLVQALRYDPDPLNSTLLTLLVARASENFHFCSQLYWYATVETHAANDIASVYKRVNQKLRQAIPANFRAQLDKQVEVVKTLARVQADAGSASSRPKKKERCVAIIKEGSCGVKDCFALSPHGGGSTSHSGESGRAGGMLAGLGKNIATAKASVANLVHSDTKKEEHADPEAEAAQSVTTPLFPEVAVTGISHEDVYLFKSAKTPMALSFLRANEQPPLRLMYKSGDDIRQDQLVVQMIDLINKLLLQDGLDLKLTPYRVLATSVDDGLIEMVPQVTQLQTVLENIHGHLRKVGNYDPAGEFQLSKECLDNWVKSNAGYAIITFMLGIGDRHLENLLVTNDGKILHIDFGFILGRDPKPFPPPLKLRKEMVDAMGGTASPRFNEFKKLCCSAFNIVRKHSPLLLNTLAMMCEANIPDLTSDVRTTKDVCAKIRAVEAKLRLDLNDSEATNYFVEVLNEAINSIFGKIADAIHKKANQLRQ